MAFTKKIGRVLVAHLRAAELKYTPDELITRSEVCGELSKALGDYWLAFREIAATAKAAAAEASGDDEIAAINIRGNRQLALLDVEQGEDMAEVCLSVEHFVFARDHWNKLQFSGDESVEEIVIAIKKAFDDAKATEVAPVGSVTKMSRKRAV
jgi:hypothetical protein